MAQLPDIVIRNFYRMMRCGALNENVAVEPMSAYKWRRTVETAAAEGVADIALRAAKNLQFERDFNMPAELRTLLQEEANRQRGRGIRPEMNNPSLEKKMKRIIAAGKHSEDCSKETLEAFGLIIANCQQVLVGGASVRLVIRLGNHLRVHGKRIDFEKVTSWLRELQMSRVATLVGSVLMANFAFKAEEVPFVKKADEKAAKMMTSSLAKRQSGEQNRGFAYFEYAPLENVSIILKSLKSRLDAIEE
ncbi:MAG: hypothetical protein LUI08_02775 [Prevotella sp.]|nr:hypothetical protein [Prevotella sp.]